MSVLSEHPGSRLTLRGPTSQGGFRRTWRRFFWKHPTNCTFSEAPKVHFNAAQLPEHESEIVIRPESDDSIAVHLGFLQVRSLSFLCSFLWVSTRLKTPQLQDVVKSGCSKASLDSLSERVVVWVANSQHSEQLEQDLVFPSLWHFAFRGAFVDFRSILSLCDSPRTLQTLVPCLINWILHRRIFSAFRLHPKRTVARLQLTS